MVKILSHLEDTTEMANKTNCSNDPLMYEYYFDYLDLLPVDATKLKAYRYSIVIAFWIGLASFVAFLFFILFYISRSGPPLLKNGRLQKMCPWNYSKTSHQDRATNHRRPIAVANQAEEAEENSSNMKGN
uniref:Melanocortin-2 receptor accessory protein n=1 Tax=Salvator merianae TaxID=96440 RepID=A0A8D0ED22_SALMN